MKGTAARQGKQMKETNDKLAVSIFFGILWLFITGVTSFFSYLLCEILFKGGIVLIILLILKGGYDGIFRKRKHAY